MAIDVPRVVKVRWLHTKEVEKNLFLIELVTGGLENLIASCGLKDAKAMVIETGPSSSIANLLSGSKKLNVKGFIDFAEKSQT